LDDLARRTTQEVLDDDLRLATEGDLDADIERNCSADIVMLTGRGIFEGHDGVRELARQLMEEVPSGEWHYLQRLVAGRQAGLVRQADERILVGGVHHVVGQAETGGQGRPSTTRSWTTPETSSSAPTGRTGSRSEPQDGPEGSSSHSFGFSATKPGHDR
jgi:hypothetical protein